MQLVKLGHLPEEQLGLTVGLERFQELSLPQLEFLPLTRL